ncbi:hypothetical protein R3W88_029394 [Solanum pinnatisectum]|uniref:RNase H type-1 domain-containing protein n=1 Tax=Solanum pinnatisectum TaxID=50273 RepID=A0AAV9K762_9SOLN|nr:hypothetical protein R3W88_029394 [Solanum pinnatisectum]
MAEAKATLNGLEWCSQNGHSNVILECDSKIVIEIIKDNYNIPWQMNNIMITRTQIISRTITCEGDVVTGKPTNCRCLGKMKYYE